MTNETCIGCGKSSDLNNHHRTYRHYRRELPGEVVPLCRTHHEWVTALARAGLETERATREFLAMEVYPVRISLKICGWCRSAVGMGDREIYWFADPVYGVGSVTPNVQDGRWRGLPSSLRETPWISEDEWRYEGRYGVHVPTTSLHLSLIGACREGYWFIHRRSGSTGKLNFDSRDHPMLQLPYLQRIGVCSMAEFITGLDISAEKG